MPLPTWVTEPVPEIALATARASVRLNNSSPLFATLPPPSEPVVPALPICNAPAEIVVVPAYVFAPVRVVVPEPTCVTEPVPEIALATDRALVRLKSKAALLTTLPEPSDPVVPVLPICKAPPLMVVVPV